MACNVLTGYNWTVELYTDDPQATVPGTPLWDGGEASEITVSWDTETITKQALDETVPCTAVTAINYSIDVTHFISATYPFAPNVGDTVWIVIKDSQATAMTVYEGAVILSTGSVANVTPTSYVTEQATFVSAGPPKHLAEVVAVVP